MIVVLFYFFLIKGINCYICIFVLRNFNNILLIFFKYFEDKFYLVQLNVFVLVYFKCYKYCNFISVYFVYYLCVMVVVKVIIFILYESFIGKSMQNINVIKNIVGIYL